MQHVAGVDLASPGFEERIAAHRSITESCRGQPLINRDDPDASLLVALVDPSVELPCGVPMPIGSPGVSAENAACFRDWARELALLSPPPPQTVPFDPAGPEAIVAKVKALAHGGAVRAAELERVRAEGTPGLKALVEGWVDTTEFRVKMQDFFEVSLQQRVNGLLGLQFRTRLLGRLQDNLEDAFVRTALDIMASGRPWTEVTTSRRWWLTSAALAALRYADEGFDRTVQYAAAEVTEADFDDGRWIELVPARDGEPLIDFRDLPALRRVQSRLAVRIPRLGFFSTPAFFSNAETNDDNRFRVTTNQALIAALGRDFMVGDSTLPPRESGIDAQHSDPSSSCYGCHKNLDPMRLYFEQTYDIFYRRNPRPTAERPSFAFLGHVVDGPRMEDFAEALNTHPRFADAWTEKLCQWFTSRPCRTSDPELARVARVFREGGFDFRALAIELLTSPVVTGAESTETWSEEPFLVSITRRSHLCRLLDARLGTDGLCEQRPVAALLGFIPNDDFSRGKIDFVQTAAPSAFHFAGAEQLCSRIAQVVVGERFSPADPTGSIASLVEDLMGLPENHPRHDRAIEVLTGHHAEVGGLPAAAMRAAFVLACLSPDVMGLGL